MVSGSETEDLDVGLLVAARSGEIDAIAAVCGHYRGRLMILARNAGANEPEVVVQNALTETLLKIEPVEAPSLAEFERTLFDRVVVDSDPVPPRPGRPDHGDFAARGSAEDSTEPALPVHPGQVTAMPLEDIPFLDGPITADLWAEDEQTSRLFDGEPWIDDRPLGAPVPGLAALTAPEAQMAGGEPALFGSVSTAEVVVADRPPVDPLRVETAQLETAQFETASMAAGGALLNPHTGPVDWSASLAAHELPAEPVLVAPSKRLLAGAAAVICGIGLVAVIALFFGGDDSTDEPQLAALVPPNGDHPPAAGGSASGPESASGGASDQNRSSGAVTGSTEAAGSNTTAQQPETTAAPSSTASTTVTTGPPSTTASTAPPTTAEPSTTTEAPTTTQPETTSTRPETTTTSGPRPGDFSNQSLDNRTFRNGDFRDHDFTNTRLNNVDFRGADLRGVSFAGAVLTNVQFSEVDLTNASFRGADMDSTFFDRRSNISGVDFRNSKLTNGRVSGFFFGDNEPRSWPGDELDDDDD